MKKVLIFAVAVMAFIGCSPSGSTPEAVAKEFATALDKGDWKKAKSLGTEGTEKMIGMLESFAAMGGDKAKAELGKGKFDKVTCEGTEADKKTCKVCCGSDDKDMPLELVKEGGKWKVNMTKDGMPGGDSEMPETTPDTTGTN